VTAGLVWSVVLAALGVVGLWRAGSGKRSGWVIGLAAQLLWLTYALVSAQYGFILSAVAYGVVYGRNLLRARRPAAPRGATSAHFGLDARRAHARGFGEGYDAGIAAEREVRRRQSLMGPAWPRDVERED
jgi:hypothetical protein